MSSSNRKQFSFCLKQLTPMRLLLRVSIPAVMLALTAIWAMPHVASADGFEVNRTYDLKDATPGDGKCETAIGNGICTLRAAIEESNENGRWNNIFLPKGNYRLTRGALPPMTSSMIIQGEGPDASVIWGPCTSNEREKESGHCIPHGAEFRVLEIASGSVGLFEMTIQGGFGPEGAGILNRGTLELHHVTVIGNTAHEGAGGIANLDGGALLLANSTVRENFSHHGPSGGIGNGSLQDSSFSELWIFNSTISGNQVVAGDFSYDAYGGGIINMGLLAIQNSTISENKVLNSDNPAVGGILNLGTGRDDHRGESWLNTVTIAANAGNYREDTTGGVMNLDGNFYYANSIIAGNDEASWKGDCRGYLTTLRGNLVGELGKVQPCRIKAWAGLPATTPIDRVGRTISGPLHWDIFVAPGEGEFKGVNVGRPLLANNGGLTCTHALCGSGMGNCASAQRSLAINAAWQNKPGTFSLACEATDQRGVPRRSCDSGAFEAELNPNPPNSLQCSPIIRLR